jgi:hypothetical protein
MASQQQPALPTFVKSLLLLVLPNNKTHHDDKLNKNETIATNKENTSPFEEMYFSFPALAEEEDHLSSSSTCGQQHREVRNHHVHRHGRNNAKPAPTTNNSNLIY